jgi:hypothetical protein
MRQSQNLWLLRWLLTHFPLSHPSILVLIFIVKPPLSIRRRFRPAFGRVLPVLPPTIRRKVEKSPGAGQIPRSSLSSRHSAVVMKSLSKDEAHGTVQPMGFLNAVIFAIGARATIANNVSRACKCARWQTWSAKNEQPSQK